jgi:hypothetical protein
MRKAALYIRVSTVDQHPETQLHDLHQFASQRGVQIVQEYTDHGFSGTKARRPALDQLMEDARRRKFDVLIVWSIDRLARSTKHLLQTLDELNGLGIQFLSQREAIDTEGPLGRAIIVIVSAMAELERCVIIERVRAGMRRKAVLPALVPELSYEGMAVANGQAAGLAWESLVRGGLDHYERERTRKALLEYCSQDTRALVRLLEILHLHCSK